MANVIVLAMCNAIRFRDRKFIIAATIAPTTPYQRNRVHRAHDTTMTAARSQAARGAHISVTLWQHIRQKQFFRPEKR